MIRIICLTITLALLFAPHASALDFHGFAIQGYDSRSNTGDSHVRIIFQEKVSNRTLARLTLTPKGPLDTLTYYEFVWRQPTSGISEVIIGRTFPPFGREWYLYRADEIPTLTYSRSNDPLSVTDTGITASGRTKRSEWWLGGYSGDRTFGNERRFEGGGNGYARIEYALNPRLELGSSYRVGPREAAGLDLYYRHSRITGIAESVRSEGKNRYALIGMVDYGRSGCLLRTELLNPGTQWTVAFPYRFSDALDFRIGYLFGTDQSGMVIARMAGRW